MAGQSRIARLTVALALALALLVVGAGACNRGSTSSSVSKTSSISSSRAVGAESSGPLPAELDTRLAGRDITPLPDGALLRFQAISRTPDPRSNHRWVLHEDGRLFLAFHSDDSEGAAPFDTSLPTEPTALLDAAEVSELLDAVLDGGRFAALDPFQQGPPSAEGGMWRVVTARGDDGRVHEVVYDRVNNAMLGRLQRVGSTYRAG